LTVPFIPPFLPLSSHCVHLSLITASKTLSAGYKKSPTSLSLSLLLGLSVPTLFIYKTLFHALTMLFTQIAFSALAMGSAVAATNLNERFVDDGFNALTKRQQFVPTTQTAAGSTCADAFGAGYVTCKSDRVTLHPCARSNILTTTPY
jgi:hypothetical protein